MTRRDGPVDFNSEPQLLRDVPVAAGQPRRAFEDFVEPSYERARLHIALANERPLTSFWFSKIDP